VTGVAIVDVGPLADGPDPGVGRELLAARHDPGFIYVRNHGVGEGVIAALRHAAWEFFSVDDQTKGRYRVSRHHRGWIAPGGARMADDVPADLKESFVWGSEAERPVPAHSLRGPNRWPHEVPGLPLAAAAWFEEASQLAVRILQAMALALGEPPHHFLSPCERPLSRGSVIRYPPQAAGTRGYGVGPHTDFGTLTVLCQDDIGGLQVQTVDGEWIDAPPVAGALVVNVGDLLSLWTGGSLRSAPHRVINRSPSDRLSLVLAFDPDPEMAIGGVSCGQYLDQRFDRAFVHREGTP